MSTGPSNKKALKSGIWYTASNFFVRSIGFITTPIFTRLLTKAEFGDYNNFASWLSIVTIVVTLNLEATLISARFDYKDNFDEYIFSSLSLSSISVFVWFTVVNLFPSVFTKWMDMDLTYINAMLLYLLFLPAVNQFQARERYRYEYKMTVLSSVIVSLGTTVVSVVMVVSMKDRLFGRIIGSVIPTILVGAIFFGFFVRKGKRIRPKYWKYALPLCLPFIPHLLSLNMLHTMDRIMITKWCGSEDTAVYSLAYTCGSLITLLMTSMNSAYSPWLGDKLNKDERSEVRKFSKPYIFAFAFCAVGVMAIAPEILLILGSKGYSEAKYVMTPIAAGCVCQFLYTLFVNVEQFKKKTVGMAFASMTAALVNLVLNWIFIPRFGYLAAAYTTLAGYLVLLAIHMALVHRIKYSDVYDYKLIICVVAVMLVIMVLITLLYKLTLIRYIFVGLYAAVCVLIFIKYKSKVLGFLKKK